MRGVPLFLVSIIEVRLFRRDQGQWKTTRDSARTRNTRKNSAGNLPIVVCSNQQQYTVRGRITSAHPQPIERAGSSSSSRDRRSSSSCSAAAGLALAARTQDPGRRRRPSAFQRQQVERTRPAGTGQGRRETAPAQDDRGAARRHSFTTTRLDELAWLSTRRECF